MKRLLLTVSGLAIAVFAIAQQLAMNTNNTANFNLKAEAAFLWETTEYSFGKIPLGNPVTHEFSFFNSGNSPLVISSVQASCGCTVTAYSKDPIEPGGKGFVKATYNAAKPGQFSKTVTVNANTPEGSIQLTIKGEVLDKAK